MLQARLTAALAIVAVAAMTQAGLAAGPVAPLSAPDALVMVKDGRKAAAATVAGAAILLGVLAATNANADAAPPPDEYVVEPDPYSRVPDYGDSDYYDFVRRNPGTAAEACRRGILKAARQYGADDAEVNGFSRLRYVGDATVRFQATITVFYPEASRRSNVTCTVQEGYLLSARAVR
jgi:hypothetical protein